jgi:membrane protein YdbS with pleckstrin-like domain
MTTQTRRERADALARQRYMIMNAARLGGVALLMFGIAIIQRVIDWPFAAGVVIAVAGFVDFFVVPLLLARAWKSQPPAPEDTPEP